MFNLPWRDKKSFILNLLIHTTGLRNCEIERFTPDDIIDMEGQKFIDVKRSKTKNGVRLVPLHPFVYKKLIEYIKDAHGKLHPLCDYETYSAAATYTAAARALASMIRLDAPPPGVTFYSGRHFWKTFMNAHDLGGDVEELFMGHQVRGDVKETYNHRNRQGRALFLAKARKVCDILDSYLFSG